MKVYLSIGNDGFSFDGETALFDQPNMQHALASWLSAAQPLNPSQLDRIEGMVTTIMAELDDLKGAVAKLVTDIDTTLAEGQGASDDLHKQIDAAIAAGKASADELAAMKAAAVDMTAALNAADVKVTDAGARLSPPVQLPPAVTDSSAQ